MIYVIGPHKQKNVECKIVNIFLSIYFIIYFWVIYLNPLYTGNPLRGTLANSEDPDEMQHYAAFHQGLHCLQRLKQPLGTQIHHNLENSTCDPLKYTMSTSILIVSICMGNSIRIQRVSYVRRQASSMQAPKTPYRNG